VSFTVFCSIKEDTVVSYADDDLPASKVSHFISTTVCLTVALLKICPVPVCDETPSSQEWNTLSIEWL